VASILKHTKIPYEIIIADDNSTDETVYLKDVFANVIDSTDALDAT
jgi:glycosyltransferase involved in cell wall biosynthesis